MLSLNSTILAQVVNSAKNAAANDPRWLRAIDKAADQLQNNPYIEAVDSHTLIIGSESGKCYTSNGVCQCEAYQHNKPCYHRAAARLYQRYNEATARRAAYEVALAEVNELFA